MLVTGLVHYVCYIAAAPSESFKAHKYLEFSALKILEALLNKACTPEQSCQENI
jgi:hypothetical protein